MNIDVLKKKLISQTKQGVSYRLTIKIDENLFINNLSKYQNTNIVIVNFDNIQEIRKHIISNYKNKSYSELLANGDNQMISFEIFCNDEIEELIGVSYLEELSNIICKSLNNIIRYKNRATNLLSEYKM